MMTRLRKIEIALTAGVWLTVLVFLTKSVWPAGVQSAMEPPALGSGTKNEASETASAAKAAYRGPAYTIHLKETLIGPQGREPGMSRIDARMSDGSTVTRIDFIRGTRAEAQRHIVFSSGRLVLVNDMRGLFTSKMSANVASSIQSRDPDHDCKELAPRAGASEVILERVAIHGYATVALKRGDATTWRSPELACAELAVRMVYPLGDASEQRAESIILGEPSIDLYRLDGLREVPLEVFRQPVRQASGDQRAGG